jgi:2-succinyl-5-enolpyruvyl-6-hydroxy-3-cyclohexene-1-carboxylate synthase
MSASDPDSGTADVGAANATFCATLVDEWVRGGVRHAVVCPGSRSTPMALALAADGRLRVHVHHDERSGAFLALGLGRATGQPAVVLTTSGTAAVELHPAVVEAHLDRVPLIAVTADRPPELREVGAPQTVDQTHLYGRATRWFADPGPPDLAVGHTWRSLGARVVAEAVGSPPGPVHLNLPFREPLVGTVRELSEGRPGGEPWHRTLGRREAGAADVRTTVEFLRGASRGVIVAGAGIVDPGGVHVLAEATGWPVLADPRSGCRTERPNVVAHADALLRVASPLREAEVVVRFGAPPASKVMAQWLDGLAVAQVLVDRDGAWLDPGRTAALVVAAEPGTFARQLAPLVAGPTSDPAWAQAWRTADAAVEASFGALLDGPGPVTEPGVARSVAASVPDGGALVVSSSMPVRDVEWFATSRDGLTVHANRGANGIDGVVSTAVGVAASGTPTALLIGDVAFLHDTNGLLGLGSRDVDLVIVVVDNDGGGIFSFLPQATSLDPARFDQLFGTPHGVDLASLAVAHGLALGTVDDAAAVGPAVASALADGGVHVLRVVTDRTANVEIHDRLNAAAAEAVAALD